MCELFLGAISIQYPQHRVSYISIIVDTRCTSNCDEVNTIYPAIDVCVFRVPRKSRLAKAIDSNLCSYVNPSPSPDPLFHAHNFRSNIFLSTFFCRFHFSTLHFPHIPCAINHYKFNNSPRCHGNCFEFHWTFARATHTLHRLLRRHTLLGDAKRNVLSLENTHKQQHGTHTCIIYHLHTLTHLLCRNGYVKILNHLQVQHTTLANKTDMESIGEEANEKNRHGICEETKSVRASTESGQRGRGREREALTIAIERRIDSGASQWNWKLITKRKSFDSTSR